jgi:hypothetical protein
MLNWTQNPIYQTRPNRDTASNEQDGWFTHCFQFWQAKGYKLSSTVFANQVTPPLGLLCTTKNATTPAYCMYEERSCKKVWINYFNKKPPTIQKIESRRTRKYVHKFCDRIWPKSKPSQPLMTRVISLFHRKGHSFISRVGLFTCESSQKQASLTCSLT